MFVLRSNPIRNLFWGLVCFSILMLFIAWAGIGSLFVPSTPGEPVRFLDMPAPLLALNLALCFLPLAAGFLILAGVSWTVLRIPRTGKPVLSAERERVLADNLQRLQDEVDQLAGRTGPEVAEAFDRLRTSGGASLTWRIKGVDVNASGVGLTILFATVVLYIGFVLAAFVRIGGPPGPILGLTLGILPGSLLVALGWYLMFLSGWALAPLATRQEQGAILVAVSSSGLFAAALIGAGLGATLALGSAALEPGAVIPPRVPWAMATAGPAGFAALVVLTLLARRIGHRYRGAATAASEPAS